MTATRRKGTLVMLSRLSKLALRATPEELLGLSVRHYMALWQIETMSDGSIAQQALAESMCIDANNTVILLNELEAEGWARRERDPADRRRHIVTITAAGRAKVEHAMLARDAVEDEVLGPLSERERETLHHLVAKALGADGIAGAATVNGG